jgi:1-acyl-sn-glycerol-3-phosphate acyltransferase
LACSTGVPIVPAGILGTRSIQPPDAILPRPFMPAEIRFGRPIDPHRYPDSHGRKLRYRQITDELMYEIRALTDQDYVNNYATKPARPTDRSTSRAVDPDEQAPQSSAEVLMAAGSLVRHG